jgi:large repetitive protein
MLLGLLVAFASQASWALAGTSGGIAGTVTDAKTGAPIPGVKLQIASPSETVNTTTDAHGHFIVFSLEPDTYTLTAEKDGYSTRSAAGYSVYADQTQQYDLSLTPAPAATPPGQ